MNDLPVSLKLLMTVVILLGLVAASGMVGLWRHLGIDELMLSITISSVAALVVACAVGVLYYMWRK